MTTPIMLATPNHVPAGRVVDIDIYDLPGAHEDVHAAWLRLQGEHDLVWTPRNGGHWIATGGALIMQLYRDGERFSNREIAVPAGSMLIPTLPSRPTAPRTKPIARSSNRRSDRRRSNSTPNAPVH
jgi:hypothetical protein